MLVLSRRLGESVVIGHDITVTVLEVRGEMVRLGIDAPRSVQVHREEVFRELQEANRAAAAADDATAATLARALGRAPRGDERRRREPAEREPRADGPVIGEPPAPGGPRHTH